MKKMIVIALICLGFVFVAGCSTYVLQEFILQKKIPVSQYDGHLIEYMQKVEDFLF